MNFEMPIVIDKAILDEIPENKKFVDFLLFWLQENETKAVIIKSSWQDFEREWNAQLEDGESKFAFFQFIRGVVRPYRKDGYNHEVEDQDPVKETIKIVNRDYDIVKYLIVSAPEAYRQPELKISHTSVVDLSGFYAAHEVGNTAIYQKFQKTLSDELDQGEQ